MKTVDEAKLEFFAGIKNAGGCACEVCGRFGKLYARKFNRGMGLTLSWLYANAKGEYKHLPSDAPRHVLCDNQVGKLLFWGLAERKPNTDDPSKHQLGWWKITDAGASFIEGHTTVNSHVIEFNGEVFGWREAQVSMSDVLGEPFQYQELMEAP